MKTIDAELEDQLIAFGEYAAEVTDTSLRVLAFVCLASINRKVVAREYGAAKEDAEILVAAIAALIRREGK